MCRSEFFSFMVWTLQRHHILKHWSQYQQDKIPRQKWEAGFLAMYFCTAISKCPQVVEATLTYSDNEINKSGTQTDGIYSYIDIALLPRVYHQRPVRDAPKSPEPIIEIQQFSEYTRNLSKSRVCSDIIQFSEWVSYCLTV